MEKPETTHTLLGSAALTVQYFIRNETETEGISKIITLQIVAQFLYLDEHFRSTMCSVFSHCVFAPSRQPVSWLVTEGFPS